MYVDLITQKALLFSGSVEICIECQQFGHVGVRTLDYFQ